MKDKERDELILDNLRLVYYIARGIQDRTGFFQFDELVGAGMLGLVKTANKFDPAKGYAFTTYAAPRIRGEMLDEIRKTNGRRFHPKFIGLTFTDKNGIEHERQLPSDIKEVSLETRDQVAFFLSKLSGRKRKVMELRFQNDLKLREIAKLMNLTESRICQIIKESISDLTIIERIERK